MDCVGTGRVASWFAWSFSLVPQLGLVRSWFINLPPSHRRSPLGVSARVGRGGLVGKHRAPSHRRPQVSGHTIEDTGLIRPWFSSVPPSQTRSAVGVCAPVGHGRLVEKNDIPTRSDGQQSAFAPDSVTQGLSEINMHPRTDGQRFSGHTVQIPLYLDLGGYSAFRPCVHLFCRLHALACGMWMIRVGVRQCLVGSTLADTS